MEQLVPVKVEMAMVQAMRLVRVKAGVRAKETLKTML
jgi:hypothetical protein